MATTPYDNDDMDVDIDGLRDSAQRSLSAADDSRFLPDDPPAQVTGADTSKKRKKSTVVAAYTKKNLQALDSDDEESDSHIERDALGDLSGLASPLSEISEDFELDTPPKRGTSKAKASATKGKPGKVKFGQLKGAKAKGLKDKERDREILMKDERKLIVPPATTSRASSAAAQSQPSDLFSNDDLAPSAVDPLLDASQAAKDPFSQTIPKKRKLPTIKKTKTATSGTGTSTPTTTTEKPAPPSVQELAKPSLPTSEQRKQALTGVRDVDLGNLKIYAELFKGVSPNS